MKTAIVPGTFDPITNGHLNIIKRAAKLFNHVIIGVAKSAGKHPIFSLEKRVELARNACVDIPNVEVKSFDGLLVEFAKECNAQTVVKGLRIVTDFDYEIQMASLNRKLNPELESVFLMSSPKYCYVSSTQIRELAYMGGDYTDLVPECVSEALAAMFDA